MLDNEFESEEEETVDAESEDALATIAADIRRGEGESMSLTADGYPTSALGFLALILMAFAILVSHVRDTGRMYRLSIFHSIQEKTFRRVDFKELAVLVI